MTNKSCFFVCYEWTNADGSVKRLQNMALGYHPFEWMKEMREKYPNQGYGAIISITPISPEEFDLYKKTLE